VLAVITDAVQLLRGHGYPVERMMCDAKITPFCGYGDRPAVSHETGNPGAVPQSVPRKAERHG
jgi:hypothetical protein